MQVTAFKRTDEDFYKAVHLPKEPESNAGTTALAALIAGDAMSLAYHGLRTHAGQCVQADGRGLL